MRQETSLQNGGDEHNRIGFGDRIALTWVLGALGPILLDYTVQYVIPFGVVLSALFISIVLAGSFALAWTLWSAALAGGDDER